MKAAIYSRKSKFTGKGESVENQIQLCREYGMKYFSIADSDFYIYEDEGFSGGNTNRPQFKKLLKDAGAKKFDVLICYRLDRISRNVSDFSQLIKDLNKFNVNFVSIREQFDTTTPMGRAMMYIASVFSQLERETIAERIKDNMMQLAKTGQWLGGTPPTGYKSEEVVSVDSRGKSKKMHKLVPIADEINLIKLIYSKYAGLKSITQVEKYLIENNIHTKNGQDFHRYSIRFILSNPVYAIADMALYNYLIENGYDVFSDLSKFNGNNGLIGYNKTIQVKEDSAQRNRDSSEWIMAVGLHEGIIPASEWIRTQELLSNNKSKSYRKVKNSQALLSGILRCAECGSFMRPKTVQRNNSEGKQAFYYMCEMKEKSRKLRCKIPNINGNALDKAVLMEIKLIISKYSPVFEDVFKKIDLVDTAEDAYTVEYEVLQAKVSEADAAIQNLIAVTAKGQKNDVLELILNKVDVLRKEKEALKRQIDQMQKAGKTSGFDRQKLKLVAGNLKTLDDSIWDMMDVHNKRNIIKSAVDRIIWDGNKLDMFLY